MYEAHFGLSEKPFSIAPDPQYLFMSRSHKEAMAHLSYGVQQGGGFILLTGEVGTGKTTLCRNLLQGLPENINLALILNAAVQKDELLQSICDELEIKYKKSDSQKSLLNLLNQYLLDSFSQNQKTVLIIDEAQLLSRDVLEQIRMLTNLETTKNKLLQIILIGQPELNDILKRQDLRQLSQRVTARYHLNSLQREDITEYVTTRLKVAGCIKPIFTKQALTKIHRLTRGIPRLINVLCDHSLIAAYSKDSHLVDVKAVKQGAKDMMLDDDSSTLLSWFNWSIFWPSASILTCLALMGAVWFWFMQPDALNGVVDSKTVIESVDKVDVKTENETTAKNEASKPPKVIEKEAVLNDKSGETEVASKQPKELKMSAAELASSPLNDSLESTPQQLSTSADTFSKPSQSTLRNDKSRFNQLLSEKQAHTSRIQAFRNLSKIWDTSLPSVMLGEFCEEVRKLELDCYAGESNSLQELAGYNRPTILVLENATGVHRVILRGINETEAQVQVGQSQVTVSRNELKQLWNGKYLLYWQAPAVGYRLFQKGNSGAQVVWLRQQINFALLKNQQAGLEDTVSSFYDEKLSQVVRGIQTDAGIIPDGQVGLQTYLIINQMLNTRNIPKLQKFEANLNASVNSDELDKLDDPVNQELDKKAL